MIKNYKYLTFNAHIFFFQDYDFDENVYHNDDGEEEGDKHGEDDINNELNKQGMIIFGSKTMNVIKAMFSIKTNSLMYANIFFNSWWFYNNFDFYTPKATF